MTTAGNKAGLPAHIDFLDHLRGVAVLMVFLYHALGQAFKMSQLPWLGWFHDFHVPPEIFLFFPVMVGWCGVAVFFALSGFCIHLSYERSRTKNMGVFYVRRFFRIYPPYLICLLIFSFVYPWRGIDFQSPDGSLNFFSHLFLLHNLDHRVFYGINVAFWSIAVEFQLYLIYPILLWLVRRCGWISSLVFLGVIELGLRLAEGYWNLKYNADLPYFILGSPFYFWFSWAIGAWLANAYVKGKPLPFVRIPVRFWIGVTLVTVMIHPLLPLAFPVMALATVAFIARQLTRPKSLILPGLSHLRFAGGVSYSLYLLHVPLLHVTMRGIEKTLPALTSHPTLLFAIYALEWFPILGVSWLFFRWIEKPSIDAGKWILKQVPRPAA
ncbi:MAG: acyltransferase [Chthoniobacterales bacterium]